MYIIKKKLVGLIGHILFFPLPSAITCMKLSVNEKK